MSGRARRHETEDGLPAPELLRRGRTWRVRAHQWCAVSAFVGAVASGVFGATLLAAACVAGAVLASAETTVADALLFAVIPLLLAGALNLDWLERAVDGAGDRRGADYPAGSKRYPVHGSVSR
jgi:hypothetical protein